MKIQSIKVNGQMQPLPEYQEEIDNLKSFKIVDGKEVPIIYNQNITAEQRDGRKHRRLMALVKVAFDNQHETSVQFKNIDNFRSELLKKAGHCEEYINFKGIRTWVAKSISYSAIDQIEADRIYENLVQVVLEFVLIGSKQEDVDTAVEVAMRF